VFGTAPGQCPTFAGPEGEDLAPVVLPRVGHVALPGTVRRQHDPLLLAVHAYTFLMEKPVQVARRGVELVGDAGAPEPLASFHELVVERCLGQVLPYNLAQLADQGEGPRHVFRDGTVEARHILEHEHIDLLIKPVSRKYS